MTFCLKIFFHDLIEMAERYLLELLKNSCCFFVLVSISLSLFGTEYIKRNNHLHFYFFILYFCSGAKNEYPASCGRIVLVPRPDNIVYLPPPLGLEALSSLLVLFRAPIFCLFCLSCLVVDCVRGVFPITGVVWEESSKRFEGP